MCCEKERHFWEWAKVDVGSCWSWISDNVVRFNLCYVTCLIFSKLCKWAIIWAPINTREPRWVKLVTFSVLVCFEFARCLYGWHEVIVNTVWITFVWHVTLYFIVLVLMYWFQFVVARTRASRCMLAKSPTQRAADGVEKFTRLPITNGVRTSLLGDCAARN